MRYDPECTIAEDLYMIKHHIDQLAARVKPIHLSRKGIAKVPASPIRTHRARIPATKGSEKSVAAFR